MSLTRYYNRQRILDKNYPTYGKLYDPEFLSLLDYRVLTPWIYSLEDHEGKIESELHLYTFAGDLLASSYNSDIQVHPETRELLLDVKTVFNTNDISTGSYKAVLNLILPVAGNINDKIFQIVDISPNKTEIQLKVDDPILHNTVIEYLHSMYTDNSLNDNVINLGDNQIYNIINYRYDASYIYLKTSRELEDLVEEKMHCYLGFEVSDPYVDNLIITHDIMPVQYNKMRGPRFDMDGDQIDSNSTIYKCWEELLSTDQSTSQSIINSLLNLDDTVTLNIDYSYFENYIFYSSAEQRLKNFFEKVLMINTYNLEIIESQQNTGSYIDIDVDQRREYINKIKTSFDTWERWLYYHSDEDLFTHDITGPVKPYPKTFVNNAVQLKAVDDTSVLSWYNNLLELAKTYDKKNTKSLWWSIPEHILMDDGNSEYILFVEMIGQHFDNIWLYITALTSIHERDEHPERGAPNELLYYIAKSFGWNLQNTRVLSDLWLYKEGSDIDGNRLDIDTHENQTQQVWRRLVNNLPHLLKTKGTSRSIHSLMSIYGIPRTLISIKEYGGPGLDGKKPVLIEDRYHYKLNVDTTKHIRTLLDPFTCDAKGWSPAEPCNDPQEDIFKNPRFKYGLQHWTITGDLPGLQDVLPSGHPLHDEFGKTIVVDPTETVNIYQELKLTPGNYYNLTGSLTNNTGTINLLHNNVIQQTWTASGNPTIGYYFKATGNDKIEFDIVANTGTVTLFALAIDREDEYTRLPDTYEYRFELDGNYSDLDNVLVGEFATDVDTTMLLVIEKRVSFNDETLGVLKIIHTAANTDISVTETAILPLFNKDYWTIRIQKDDLILTTDSDPGTIHVDIASAGDCLYGRLTHHETLTITGAIGNIFNSSTSPKYFRIGDNPVNYTQLTFVPFDGNIQGYKEYFGCYSTDTYTEHVLNPAAYSVDDFKSTRYSLWKYFPLGLDLQRWPHDAPTNNLHESSQPDRNQNPSDLELFNYSTDQTDNYLTDSETYYIHVPKIGGRTVQSQKIRLEDINLEYKLSPDKTAISSEYDYLGPDQDKLAIVFSLADQINRDIYNHMGVSDLDTYIGDPEYEFQEEYVKFNNLRRQYFSKYTQKNDINAFIRIFSIYDYTFFEQLKQLVPARANLITGILIEPHILERNKVVISKRPFVEAPLFEDDVDLNIWNEFAENILQEGLVDIDVIAKLEYSILHGIITSPERIKIFRDYIKACIELNPEVFMETVKMSSCIVREFDLTGSEVWLSNFYAGALQVLEAYTGMTGSLEPIYENPPKNCKYKKKICFYSPYTKMVDYTDLGVLVDRTKYLLENESDVNVTLTHPFNEWTNFLDPHPRYDKSIDMPVDFKLTKVFDTDEGDYQLIIYANSQTVGTDAELDIEIETSNGTTTETYSIPHCDPATRLIRPLIIDLIGLTSYEDAQVYLENVGSPGIDLFSIEMYKKLSSYEKSLLMLHNRLCKIPDFCILKDVEYQIDEHSIENNKRFRGSKLTGPGINIPSDETFDKGPVVSFTEVNPNTLINTNENSSSNLRVG